MRRIERDEGSRASSPRGSSGSRARGRAPRKSDRVHNGSRENIVVGHPTTGDAARVDDAARRRATDPRHAGYRHPRQPRGRVRRGIGRRTGANLATEGGQLAGAAAQKRRPADGIRAATREVVAGCWRARAAAVQTLARARMGAVRDAMCGMLVVSVVERDG